MGTDGRSDASLRAGATTAVKFIIGLLLALVGAGWLTTEWQGRERDRDIRASLISDISTSSARASVSARFVATGAFAVEESRVEARRSRLQQRYIEGKRRWEEDSARIRAQLQAYFRGSKIADEWDQYAGAVSDFYQLSYPLPSKKDQLKRNLTSRQKWTTRIQEHIDDPSLRLSWNALVIRQNKGDKYAHDYITLSENLFKKQGIITKDILDTHTVYAPPLTRWVPGA